MIEDIKKNLVNLLPTTAYEITDWREESFIWSRDYQKHVTYLLSQNKSLVEALEAIRDYAEPRTEINIYLGMVYDACIAALTTYKGENT